MTSYSPERSLGFVLHDVSRLLRRAFDRRARTIGLTRAQWFVLAHLSRNEGINQAALADIMEIEPITLVHQLDRLEAAGWIERRLDPEDRRVRLLFLTDGGRPILDRMYELGSETRAEAVAGLSEAEHDALIDTLLRIKTNLSTTLAEPGDGPAAVTAAPARRRRRAGSRNE